MRVAVLADTHLPRGRRRLPDACLRALRAASLIVHAGDFCTVAVHDELRAIGPPLVAVRGNVDERGLRAILPLRTVIERAGMRIGVIHDAGPARGRLARLARAFPDADAVIFGHSHLPLHERDRSGFQIFNPGSPTERRRARTRAMGIATIEPGKIRFRHLEL